MFSVHFTVKYLTKFPRVPFLSSEFGVFAMEMKVHDVDNFTDKTAAPVESHPNETKTKQERTLPLSNDCNCQSKRNRETSNREHSYTHIYTHTHASSCQWQCHHVCRLVHEHSHSL